MKHIPERMMWQGKSTETGETLTGHYGKEDFEYIKPVHAHDCASWSVDPATIEPVRVKPMRDPNRQAPDALYCPNCNHDLMGGIELDAEHDPPYCWECGQAIDWQDTPQTA